MALLDLFNLTIISALDRNDSLEELIGDESLLRIIRDNYALDFINKRYINRFITNIYLQDYKCYNVYNNLRILRLTKKKN